MEKTLVKTIKSLKSFKKFDIKLKADGKYYAIIYCSKNFGQQGKDYKTGLYWESYEIQDPLAIIKEFIEVGNLIKFQMRSSIVKIEEVIKITKYNNKIAIRTTGSMFMNLNNISEIWIKENKDTYICQYRKEESNE